MRILYFGGAMCALVLHAVAADNSVKIENDQARVLVVSSSPGLKSAMHEHKMNRVMIYLDEGKMTLTDQSGKVQTLSFKAGEALWSPIAGMHTSLNVSDHPVRIVEIEIKERLNRASKPAFPELDPVKVDRKRYKVEMENDQVRVIRARYSARDKGVMHEHMLNRAVTYLTPGQMKITSANGETKTATNMVGDVTWGGPAIHIEENLNDEPFEVVVVEFKK